MKNNDLSNLHDTVDDLDSSLSVVQSTLDKTMYGHGLSGSVDLNDMYETGIWRISDNATNIPSDCSAGEGQLIVFNTEVSSTSSSSTTVQLFIGRDNSYTWIRANWYSSTSWRAWARLY